MRHPKFLSIPFIFVLGLSSCSGGDGSVNMKIYDKNSNLYFGKIDNQSSTLPLITYHHPDHANIPYVALEPLFMLMGGLTNERYLVNQDGYFIENEKDHGFFIDASKETITIQNYSRIYKSYFGENSGVGYDVFRTEDSKVIQSSSASKEYDGSGKDLGTKTREDITFDLKKYNIDIVRNRDQFYVPVDVASLILFGNYEPQIIYNGRHYFASSALRNYKSVYTYCFSSSGSFKTNDGVYYKRVKAIEDDESFRFETTYEGHDAILSLTDDETGALFVVGENDALTPVEKYTYEWKRDPNTLTLETYEISRGEKEDFPVATYLVNLKETYYNRDYTEQSYARYHYDVLRMQMDYFGGMLDVQGYKDAESMFVENRLKKDLASTDAFTADRALASLLSTALDDGGHSHFQDYGLFTGDNEENEASLGSRQIQREASKAQLLEARKEAYGTEDAEGLRIEGDTAVITIDNFLNVKDDDYATPGTIILPSKSGEINEARIDFAWDYDTSIGVASCFALLEKKYPDVKNIVFDLTLNESDELSLIPYLLSYLSKDPRCIIKSKLLNRIKDFHYAADLDGDGQAGQDGDTYLGKYNFFVLTSEATYGASNTFAQYAKDAGAKVIGVKSSGGACNVDTFVTPYGTSYKVSGPTICLKDSDGSYDDVDDGVALDKAYPEEDFYDLAKLNQFLTSNF